MHRNRLSRTDSPGRTTQRLPDAAELLIAERAGYWRGAFNSNFKSREGLFFTQFVDSVLLAPEKTAI